MKQQGLRFIDLSEAQGFDRQTMYYPHDGHLNAAGHQWIAEKLYAGFVAMCRFSCSERIGNAVRPGKAGQRALEVAMTS